MEELARKYYENYTNEYMSENFIKHNNIQTLSANNMYEFLKTLIETAHHNGMKAQAEADYRIYND